MGEGTPELRDSVKTIHPLVDVLPLFGELNTYLLAQGKDVLTKAQQDDAIPKWQTMANEHFLHLSESDGFVRSMMETVDHAHASEEDVASVTKRVIETAATAAKAKVWHALVKEHLPESFT